MKEKLEQTHSVKDINLIVARVKTVILLVREDTEMLHIDARVLVRAKKSDDALLQHVAQFLRGLRNIHYSLPIPSFPTLRVVRFYIDQANQTLTQEVVLIIQLLHVTSPPSSRYTLLILGNAVTTIPLQDDALHLHHVLLHDVKVVFKLCIRTCVA